MSIAFSTIAFMCWWTYDDFSYNYLVDCRPPSKACETIAITPLESLKEFQIERNGVWYVIKKCARKP